MRDDPVPQAAPSWRIARYRDEIDRTINDVLSSDRYVLGPRVEAFETEFADHLGLRHVVGVGSGTAALTLTLRAFGISDGHEVVTTPISAAGTAQSIRLAGARPVFADIEPESGNLDPAAVEDALTARTAAIVPVHLYGNPSRIRELREIADRRGVFLIEDCAQAHGTTVCGQMVGGFGHAAIFSFYPTKNLGCVGDGGAVATNDPALAEQVRRLRHYGWASDDRISETIGDNSRLDEIQAAILSVMLRHLADGNRERRAAATRYREAFRDLGSIALPPDNPGATYHQFVLRSPHRDALRLHLSAAHGVRTEIHYAPPLHLQPAFADACCGAEATKPGPALPLAEAFSSSVMSLPIQPEIVARYQDRIVAAVADGLTVLEPFA